MSEQNKFQILRFNSEDLLRYTVTQCNNFFPDRIDLNSYISRNLPLALNRLQECINSVSVWEKNTFNPFQSSQYFTYIYFLANTIWQETGDTEVPTRLFLLNKALNNIDCFYEILLPPHFYFGHTSGIVLSKADYGDYLVIYQNVTIGKNNGLSPTIADGVIIYPNATVLGASLIGDNSIISQGTSIIDRSIPVNKIAFRANGRNITLKENLSNNVEKFFWNIQ